MLGCIVLLLFLLLLCSCDQNNNSSSADTFFCSSYERSVYDTPKSLSPGAKRERRNVVTILIPEFGVVLDGAPCSLPCQIVDKTIVLKLIEMLDTFFLDDSQTDIIIFHEGYPLKRDMDAIRLGTDRNVDFVNIDKVFMRIPDTLDPYNDQPNWTKRGKWRYQQMIRFNVEDVFKFPIMDNVEYFMRIDIDSCFERPFVNLFSKLQGPGRPGIFPLYVSLHSVFYRYFFSFLNSSLAAVYLANNQSLEAAHLLPGTHMLEKFVKDYVSRNNIQPKSPKRWKKTFTKGSVYTYSNNFEIVSVDFFRRPEVVAFMDEVLKSLGIFKFRWGDAILRYVALTLFAAEDEVLHTKHFDMRYKHPCYTNMLERYTHEQQYNEFHQRHGKELAG